MLVGCRLTLALPPRSANGGECELTVPPQLESLRHSPTLSLFLVPVSFSLDSVVSSFESSPVLRAAERRSGGLVSPGLSSFSLPLGGLVKQNPERSLGPSRGSKGSAVRGQPPGGLLSLECGIFTDWSSIPDGARRDGLALA